MIFMIIWDRYSSLSSSSKIFFMLFSPNDVLTSKWPQKTFLQGTFTQHCKFGRGGHIQRPRSGWKLLWELLRSVHDRKILTSLKLKNRGHLAYPNFLKIKKKHQKIYHFGRQNYSILFHNKFFDFNQIFRQ